MEVVEGVGEIDDVGEFVAALTDVGDRHDVTVQAFDARYVVDRAHLDRAVELAERARERDDTIADDFGVEILLYAAGRRQIDRALRMGVSEGRCPVVAVVVGDDATDETAAASALRAMLSPAETLGDYDETLVRDFFDVTDTELAATEGTLADAVRERVAMLPVEK
ncbi:KEOPS complex subunit Cgi121 [Halomicroarcula sp. GCM10025817]|uniref:KEOPS complex subunit Cgi121 n=1 Tax=Haloarcula TaxID=2237 RepID=UPI0023E8654C|nr:KEOPS complex subunit Cgi121 [Halomicroarcula sp. SYNS111]